MSNPAAGVLVSIKNKYQLVTHNKKAKLLVDFSFLCLMTLKFSCIITHDEFLPHVSMLKVPDTYTYYLSRLLFEMPKNCLSLMRAQCKIQHHYDINQSV